MVELQFTEEHIERIVTLETKVDNIEDKIGSLNKIENAITKISTLMEIQAKDEDKKEKNLMKQSEMLSGLSKTLTKVNDNLDSLNTEIKETNIRIDKLENKFSIETEKSKIDIRDWLKTVILKFLLPTSAIGFIVYEAGKVLKIIK